MKLLYLKVLYGIKSFVRTVRKFNPNVKLFIYSNSLLQIMLGVFSTIMNIYLLKMGFSKSFIGIYMAANTMSGAIFSLPAGMLTDKIGHKKVLVGAIFLALISTLFELSFLMPSVLIVASFVKGIGTSAFMVVQNPFLMSNSGPRERIQVFSISSSASNMAAVLGSVLAGVLPLVAASLALSFGIVQNIEASSLRISLLVSIVFAVLSLIPAMMIKSENDEVKENDFVQRELPKKDKLNYLDAFKDKNIQNLTVHKFLIGVGAGFTLPFFNVYLADSLSATNREISAVTMGSRIVLTFATLLSPLLLRKFGRIRSIILTQVVAIPSLLAVTWAPNMAFVAVIYWIRTALMNMSSPISSAMAMEIVPARFRSTSSSMIHMSDAIGRSAAQIAGGWIMDNLSNELPYYITGAIYALATWFYWARFRKYDMREIAE